MYVHEYVPLTTSTNNDIQITFDVYTQLTGTSNIKKSNQKMKKFLKNKNTLTHLLALHQSLTTPDYKPKYTLKTDG